MSSDLPSSGISRFLKHRVYVLPLAVVALIFVVMWMFNRERPPQLESVSRDVLASIPDGFCTATPKFKKLITTFKTQVRDDGFPTDLHVERVDTILRGVIASRRETWFTENRLSP